MDISDILASVSRAYEDAGGQESSARDALQQEQDLHDLTQAWVAERVAPELLYYPTELVDRVMDRIRKQIDSIEERTSRMDAGTSFALVVMQTELERFKFLVRSFLRARIAKIDAHSLHLLTKFRTEAQDPSKPLLSQQELQYLEAHTALLERHYNASFLSAFPQRLQRLDDRAGAGGAGMVEGPDLDKAVFVRCLGPRNSTSGSSRQINGDHTMDDSEHNHDAVEVSCGYVGPTSREMAQRESGGETAVSEVGERRIQMRKGEIWIVRWRSVRDAMVQGQCEVV